MKIVIPEIHPSLNDWGNWHWGRRYSEKKRWSEMIFWLLHEAKAKPITGKAKVRIIYYFPDNKKRDKDNYSPKFIFDGLKNAHVISDDSVINTDCDWSIRLGTKERKSVVYITRDRVSNH